MTWNPTENDASNNLRCHGNVFTDLLLATIGVNNVPSLCLAMIGGIYTDTQTDGRDL
jgi:hypothetical protein